MLVSNFANRLNEAINIRKITPAEIVRRSEILFKEKKIFKALTKPQMSNYLKGTYEAKQDNVYALSLILDVDEAWLMGYDVPMEKQKVQLINSNITDTTGLDAEDFEEINRFIEFLKNKKKNDK